MRRNLTARGRYTILHTIGSGGPGGAETVLLHLASRIESGRFRSLALLPDGGWLPQRLREVGVPVHLINSGPWYDLRPTIAMARLIVREKVDLIHSHMVDQNFYSCLTGRSTGRKTIATYHGPVELERQGKGLKGSIKLWLVRESASAVVAVSDSLSHMLRMRGFPAHRITRIYNGVNTSQFAGRRRGRLRRELGCGEETPLVGMVGNVNASKSYDCFIGAARKVVDAIPQARFVAVGDIEPTLGQRLVDLISQLGLQNKFSFLGFRGDVPDILSDLDIFVLSSVSEGLPLAMLEAMAAAKPSIVTRSGGPQEVIEDGYTGVLIPSGDPDILATRICELISNPARAAEIGVHARAKVEHSFSLDRMVLDYERLYMSILDSD